MKSINIANSSYSLDECVAINSNLLILADFTPTEDYRRTFVGEYLAASEELTEEQKHHFFDDMEKARMVRQDTMAR